MADLTPVTSPLSASCGDGELAVALRAAHPAAALVLYDRHAEQVQGILVRVLGVDSEIPDLLHDVFVRALQSTHTLAPGQPVGSWLAGIAVFTARKCIRRRMRRRWLRFFPPEELPDAAAAAVPEEARAALRAAYGVLEKMPELERVAFALRHLEGMELTEVAAACKVSLATIKRKLERAQARFSALAARQPELERWSAEGGAP